MAELGGGIAAGYATKLLADLGADVVKVEPRGGDPLRSEGPWAPGEPQDPARGGGLWRFLNGGKRSAVLPDPAEVRALVGRAAVVVEHLGPGGLEGEWDPLESTCRHASLSIL